jgi:uncharacterized membrane protein YdjX (TVP38/TMEM64 family)
MSPDARTRNAQKAWVRPALLLGLVAAGVVLARYLGLTAYLTQDNLQDNLQLLAGWVRGLGWLGPAFYVLLWVVACLFFLPGLPVTLLGAAVFGAWWGMLWVVLGANLGASAAFLAARYAARPLVQSWAAKNQQFQRIDQGVAAHGWRMIMITRLVPLFPFNLQNYAYGLTGVGYPTYALVSLVCMLPGTAAYCLAGGALVSGQGDLTRTLLYLSLAAVCFVLLSLLPGWIKRRYALGAPPAGPRESGPDRPGQD